MCVPLKKINRLKKKRKKEVKKIKKIYRRINRKFKKNMRFMVVENIKKQKNYFSNRLNRLSIIFLKKIMQNSTIKKHNNKKNKKYFSLILTRNIVRNKKVIHFKKMLYNRKIRSTEDIAAFLLRAKCGKIKFKKGYMRFPFRIRKKRRYIKTLKLLFKKNSMKKGLIKRKLL